MPTCIVWIKGRHHNPISCPPPNNVGGSGLWVISYCSKGPPIRLNIGCQTAGHPNLSSNGVSDMSTVKTSAESFHCLGCCHVVISPLALQYTSTQNSRSMGLTEFLSGCQYSISNSPRQSVPRGPSSRLPSELLVKLNELLLKPLL